MSTTSPTAERPVRSMHRADSMAAHHAAGAVLGDVAYSPSYVGTVPLTAPRWEAALDSRYARMVKPVADPVIALLLLVALLPALLAIGLAIRLGTRSPALYRQRRVGRYGMEFVVWKFCTMRPDRRRPPGTPYDGPERRRTHKSPEDPRVTPIGRILRRWSLDELPQLWNVIRGDMSMVGPRPELVEIVQRYEPWQHRRHVVKPGITGLWQVSAREDGAMHEHVELDVEYIERFSLRTDLQILLRTVPVLFGKLSGF